MLFALTVKLTFTLPFVLAPLAYKAIHWLLVLKPVVVVIMNVLPMKSVTMLLVAASVAKNANHFVTPVTVTLVLIVLPGTIRRPADVDHPY